MVFEKKVAFEYTEKTFFVGILCVLIYANLKHAKIHDHLNTVSDLLI